MKKTKRNKKIIAVLLTCLLCVTATIPICAKETMPSGKNTHVVQDDEYMEVQISNENQKSGYYTFLRFTSGNFRGVQTYSFKTEHACKMKMMWAGKYMDGTTGTLSVTLEGPNTWQEYSINMDGNAYSIQFKGDSYTQNLPAGNYQIMLWPNDVAKEYVSAGSVYSLDY